MVAFGRSYDLDTQPNAYQTGLGSTIPYTSTTEYGPNTFLGDLSQTVPKYLADVRYSDVDISKYLDEAGNVKVYSGSPVAVNKFAKTRGTKIPPAMSDIENVFRGKGLVNEGVYASPSRTVAQGYTKTGWNPFKGLGQNIKGKIYEGIADPRLLQWSKNMFGQDQIRMASDYANQIFNRGKNIMGPFNKIGGSAINRSLARILPYSQQALGAVSAADYLSKGQNVRAGLAGLSMAPGPPGWVGLGGEAAVNYMANKKAESAANIGGQTHVGSGDVGRRMGKRSPTPVSRPPPTNVGNPFGYQRGGIASLRR